MATGEEVKRTSHTRGQAMMRRGAGYSLAYTGAWNDI